MTEKRFRVQIEAENWLVTNDNHSVVLKDKAEAHMVANMCNDVIDVLNEQNETIQRLEAQLSHIEYRFTEYRNKVGKND